MKLLVGTLYVNENEYSECLRAVREQSFRSFEHFVIEGLPEREAHDALYGRFMLKASEFQVFLKLDADMVIQNRFLFQQIAVFFQTRPEIEMLSIPVHDYFSDSLIIGMHAFRNTVTWSERDSSLYTDSHSVPHNRWVVDDGHMTPGAIHCGNSTPFQSFHLGMHRGVKLRDAMQGPLKLRHYLVSHMRSIEGTWVHFLRCQDSRLGIASLAAELSIRGDFTAEHVPYTNPWATQVFKECYSGWELAKLKEHVGRLRIRNRLRYPLLLVIQPYADVAYPVARALLPASARKWLVKAAASQQ